MLQTVCPPSCPPACLCTCACLCVLAHAFSYLFIYVCLCGLLGYTEHQTHRVISALESIRLSRPDLLGVQSERFLNRARSISDPFVRDPLPGLKGWRPRSIAGKDVSRQPNIDPDEAVGILSHAMKRVRGRFDHSNYSALVSLLHENRRGSYPRAAHHHASYQFDFDKWLVCGWNISKKKHQHVNGVFVLPMPLAWHRDMPGLRLPGDDCIPEKFGFVPNQRDLLSQCLFGCLTTDGFNRCRQWTALTILNHKNQSYIGTSYREQTSTWQAFRTTMGAGWQSSNQHEPDYMFVLCRSGEMYGVPQIRARTEALDALVALADGKVHRYVCTHYCTVS